MKGLKNNVLKEIWSKLKLAKPRPSTKDPLATGIANFAMENCPHGCVSKKKTSTDSDESEVDEVGDMEESVEQWMNTTIKNLETVEESICNL